mgnify:CR=1 FL=1
MAALPPGSAAARFSVAAATSCSTPPQRLFLLWTGASLHPAAAGVLTSAGDDRSWPGRRRPLPCPRSSVSDRGGSEEEEDRRKERERIRQAPPVSLSVLTPLPRKHQWKRIRSSALSVFLFRPLIEKIFITDVSLAVKRSYLFTRSSKSGDSKAHFFVSSSLF